MNIQRHFQTFYIIFSILNLNYKNSFVFSPSFAIHQCCRNSSILSNVFFSVLLLRSLLIINYLFFLFFTYHILSNFIHNVSSIQYSSIIIDLLRISSIIFNNLSKFIRICHGTCDSILSSEMFLGALSQFTARPL